MLTRCSLLVAFALCALSVSACSSDSHPSGMDDCVGTGCNIVGNPHEKVDSGTPDLDAAVLDATTPVPLSGQIVRFLDTGFVKYTPYIGSGILRIPVPAGDLDLTFGGAAGSTFSTTKAASGTGWFRVMPDADAGSSSSSVLSTYSSLYVPPQGATDFMVPVLDRDVLVSIYQLFPNNVSLNSNAAQVVLAFFRAGSPVKGVKITGSPTSEAIAYDDGSIYSTTATATSLRGLAILINTTGAGQLTVTSDTGAISKYTPVYVKGGGCYMPIEIP